MATHRQLSAILNMQYSLLYTNYLCLISSAFDTVPLEYLTLFFDMPYMPLLADIRQGVFYAQLLSFWLVFAGEHMLIQNGASTLKTYWKHLSAVVIGCISLFAFDVCERGAQLRNPFYSMWMTKIGANIAVCCFTVVVFTCRLCIPSIPPSY